MNNTDHYYEKIDDLLYNKDNGLLIKYHFNRGLDLVKLDALYAQLEELKRLFRAEELIPKKIAFLLTGIIPALYKDIDVYATEEQLSEEYRELIDKLDTALMMCINPDTEGPWFNTPLKDL